MAACDRSPKHGKGVIHGRVFGSWLPRTASLPDASMGQRPSRRGRTPDPAAAPTSVQQAPLPGPRDHWRYRGDNGQGATQTACLFLERRENDVQDRLYQTDTTSREAPAATTASVSLVIVARLTRRGSGQAGPPGSCPSRSRTSKHPIQSEASAWLRSACVSRPLIPGPGWSSLLGFHMNVDRALTLPVSHSSKSAYVSLNRQRRRKVASRPLAAAGRAIGHRCSIPFR